MTRAAVPAALAWGIGQAHATDQDLFVRPDDQRTVLFGSLDAGRSVFVEGGFKQTLVGPLDRTGFVAMETHGYGLTREVVRTEDATFRAVRLKAQAAVLLGHQWSQNGLFVSLFAGPEIREEQLTVEGEIHRYSEPRLGLKLQAEIWANPTTDTLFTATLVAASSRADIYARGSAGYRIGGNLFAGPEVAAYSTVTYQELRVGLHLTGFSLGLLQGRVSAGWMSTDDGQPGSPYVGLTGWIRM